MYVSSVGKLSKYVFVKWFVLSIVITGQSHRLSSTIPFNENSKLSIASLFYNTSAWLPRCMQYIEYVMLGHLSKITALFH